MRYTHTEAANHALVQPAVVLHIDNEKIRMGGEITVGTVKEYKHNSLCNHTHVH